MSKASRLTRFADVKQVLDQALASRGGTFTLATHGEAVHWRHRAYTFRKQFAEAIDGRYDVLQFPRIPAESSTVVIRMLEVRGMFTPAAVEDEFERTARELHERLSKGDIL